LSSPSSRKMAASVAAIGFLCDFCKGSFPTCLDYIEHMQEAHEPKLSFKCSICYGNYATADLFKEHKREAHYSKAAAAMMLSLQQQQEQQRRDEMALVSTGGAKRRAVDADEREMHMISASTMETIALQGNDHDARPDEESTAMFEAELAPFAADGVIEEAPIPPSPPTITTTDPIVSVVLCNEPLASDEKHDVMAHQRADADDTPDRAPTDEADAAPIVPRAMSPLPVAAVATIADTDEPKPTTTTTTTVSMELAPPRPAPEKPTINYEAMAREIRASAEASAAYFRRQAQVLQTQQHKDDFIDLSTRMQAGGVAYGSTLAGLSNLYDFTIGAPRLVNNNPLAVARAVSASVPAPMGGFRVEGYYGRCDVADCPWSERDAPHRALYRHHRKAHWDTYDWKCETCEAGFQSEETLELHNKKFHGAANNCETTGCPGRGKPLDKSHLTLHSANARFYCIKCRKSFETREQFAVAHPKVKK